MSASNGRPVDEFVRDFMTFPFFCHIKVTMLEEPQRAALFARLRQLHDLPRERWEELEAYPLEGESHDTYLVPFTDDLRVFFTPQPDGTFRVDDLTSQQRLDHWDATFPQATQS